MEYRYLARDGRVVWVLDRATLVLRNDDGDPLLFEGVMMDVTAQREAESAAQSATGQLAELLDHGHRRALLLRARRRGRADATVVYVSPKLGSYLGMTEPSLLADPRRWFDAVHPDDRVWVEAAVEHAWATGADRIGEYRVIDAERHDRLARRPDAVRGARRERPALPVHRHDHRRDRPAQRT